MNSIRFLSALRLVRGGLIAGLLLIAASAHAASTSPWTIDQLMSALAQHKSGHADFTETKYLAITAQPVVSSGELSFVAPDHLEKHTLTPVPELLVVDGGMLTIDRSHHKYTLALSHYPELGAFIESLRATLAGNRYALEQTYKLALDGPVDDWTLVLTPLDARLRKSIDAIKLDGSRDRLKRVEIRQANGDHSVMQLRAVSGN